MAAQQQSLVNVQDNLSSVSKNIEKNIINLMNRTEKKILDRLSESDGSGGSGGSGKPLGPNEYDYIIIGTGAGAAGVLLGLLEKGIGTEKILVIEKGNANTLTFNDINNNSGYINYDITTTENKLNNNDVISVETQPEDIYKLNGTIEKNKQYPILIANTVGGNTANNVGFWHHQPISTIASFPPNNLNNFDINKWENFCKLATTKLTNFDRNEYFDNSVNSNTQVFGISRITKMKENLNNLIKTKFAKSLKKFIKRYNISIPFNDSNLERNEKKIVNSTLVVKDDIIGICPPILRVFNDFNIKYNKNSEEFNSNNVRVITNTEVEKLLLNDDFTRAYGVSINNNNTRNIYTARHKIFVCAGAFDTPKLLAKSNLGKRSWYSDNNLVNPNSELKDRLDTMGQLWQTPDYSSLAILLKNKNENNGIKYFQDDLANVNIQNNIFNNIQPKLNFSSVSYLWYILWENFRNDPILGLNGKNLKDDFQIFKQYFENSKSLLFNSSLFPGTKSIKEFMESNNYTNEEINKVEEGIKNTFFNDLNFKIFSNLYQYRVVDNKIDYPGGYLDFEKDKFNYDNLKANFGWSKIEQNDNFKKSVEQSINNQLNYLFPALNEENLCYKSFNDIIDNALETNIYGSLTASFLSNYSTNTQGIPLILEPFTYTDNQNKEQTIYVSDYFRKTNSNEFAVNLSSGWHYTGTAFNISDKNTGEVVPGLMIADGSSFNGPVKNNSMASICTIGIYMANLALENKN